MKANNDEEPEKKKLRTRKKEKTREAILAAAEEFFSEKPMNEVILEDIAESAFISRTTLYNYFKNKDAIFFELGISTVNKSISNIQRFIDKNRDTEENNPNYSPGIDQYRQLIENAFVTGRDRPLIYDIIREFYKRIHDRNISLKELHEKVMKSIGTPRFEKLLENSEEPYLIEFYVQLLRNTDLWVKVIKKGKSDGTITNTLKDEQIVQFVHMLLSGLEEQMKLRISTLTRIRFEDATIIENIVNLIALFLQNKK